MATINEEYRDASLRRQIQLRRFTNGEVNRVLKLIEQADAELVEKLRKHLNKLAGKPVDFKGERLKTMLQEVRQARETVLQEFRESLNETLPSLAQVEAEAELAMMNAVVPLEVGFAAADSIRLKAIAEAKPFHGKLLKDWYSDLATRDKGRIVQALQLGLTQGETVDDIVRRVVGTRANKYTDGVLSASRREAAAVVRTAISHVSTHAREMVWEANPDIIGALIWTATLDGRTSAVCRSRDGHGAPTPGHELPEGVPPLQPAGARPPAHFNCRSTLVAYIDGVGLLGNRPSISDKRNPRQREIDFRKEARRRKMPIKDVRREWAAKHVGPVPAKVNYQEWLTKQKATFQDDVLGKTKGQLFRNGGLKLDQFVDRTGAELTLAQLAASNPAAFVRAGLDPDDF